MVTQNAGNIPTGASGTILQGQGVGTAPAFSATPSVTSITLSSGTALSTYVEGTFTPVLKFGGGTTGITYSTQVGLYTRIGRMVNVIVHIVLTNKGSSTGTATITGLPFTSNSTTGFNQFIGTVGITINFGPNTGFVAYGYIIPSATEITIAGYTGNPDINADMSNTNFANGTELFLNGTYFT